MLAISGLYILPALGLQEAEGGAQISNTQQLVPQPVTELGAPAEGLPPEQCHRLGCAKAPKSSLSHWSLVSPMGRLSSAPWPQWCCLVLQRGGLNTECSVRSHKGGSHWYQRLQVRSLGDPDSIWLLGEQSLFTKKSFTPLLSFISC